jgi:hypothetical protein
MRFPTPADFVNRTTGETGSSVVGTGIGSHGGDIQIALAGKTYSGTWVYVSDGGAVAFSNGFATSGLATATATGTIAALPTGGGGTILASAGDGSTLRCQFQYNQLGASGIGVCQDNKGGSYDLQIH